jgi:hypothetical protein
MARKKNRYSRKAKKKAFMKNLGAELQTKGNIKNTALETGKVILVGVLGGGFIGAAIGKPSLAAGIAATGLGHYTGNRLLTLVGVGMMAANGFQKSTSVSGLEGMDGIKERIKAYKESFAEKLYLDKLKSKLGTTNGFGDLQYFTYPSQEFNGDLAALNAIEDQLTQSAMQFQGQLPETDFEGVEEYNF